jgi:hypothetical protein
MVQNKTHQQVTRRTLGGSTKQARQTRDASLALGQAKLMKRSAPCWSVLLHGTASWEGVNFVLKLERANHHAWWSCMLLGHRQASITDSCTVVVQACASKSPVKFTFAAGIIQQVKYTRAHTWPSPDFTASLPAAVAPALVCCIVWYLHML